MYKPTVLAFKSSKFSASSFLRSLSPAFCKPASILARVF